MDCCELYAAVQGVVVVEKEHVELPMHHCASGFGFSRDASLVAATAPGLWKPPTCPLVSGVDQEWMDLASHQDKIVQGDLLFNRSF